MWKAAFTGRSEGGGSSSAGRPEPRRKRSHRAESVTSSRPRDEDDRERERRRSSRGGGSVYEGGERDSVYGVPRSSMSGVGYGSSPSHMAQTAPLTASALRMLPDDEEEWEDEDKDARSERKSRRSEGEKRRKSSGKDREREEVKGWERKKAKDRSRSDSREKERKKSSSRSLGKERESVGDKGKGRATERDSQSERERDSKRRTRLVESPESTRAMPEMGSFEQFPGQYVSGHMGPLPPHQQEAIMSGALPNSAPQQGQFPGQDPYHEHDSNRPPLEHSHTWGAAADYYLDAGESVQHQPGVRINSPNMLVNPDQHLVAASAQPIPAVDTGNGTANDFYSGKISPVHGAGVSASAPVTPAAKPKPKPAKQSSWSAFKPSKTSKPGKVSKPSKTSSSNAAAAALAGAAGVGVLNAASHSHASSSQQQTSAYHQGSNSFSVNASGPPLSSVNPSSKPNRHSSDGNVYYGPPPQQSQSTPTGGYAVPPSPSYTYGVPGSTIAQGGSVNAYGAQSTNGGHGETNYTNDYNTSYSTPGKQSTPSKSNAPLYAAGATAAAGLAAYSINQHHSHQQSSSYNQASSGSYGNGGQGPPRPPRPGMGGGFSHYPSSGGGGTNMHQLHHHHDHEHKGPMTRLKDGLFNLISSPEDTAKMEMYTEYIGVCKHCFDPRTSAWDAPRQHHYHKSPRRDSFESLRRRRSAERLGRKGSNDSLRRAGSVRVDKENRYYASDSSRKRRESGKGTGILGAGLAAAGVATAANAIFSDGRKDFDDTYSVKSGHRERSALRRRSRSSSREMRRKSTHGVLRPGDREEFVTVRRKDGTVEKRRVQRRSSRSSSREGRSKGFYGAAAGAALGAGAASAGMRRRSRSRSRDSKGRRSERRSPRSSYGNEEEPSGIFGGFFSPPSKKRRGSGRREHHKKKKGFFTFSNSSSSSSNSELAFGGSGLGLESKTSLPLRRKSSGRSITSRKSRRTSDDHFAATVAGIGATAAALAAAQRGGRINKRSSKVELGAKKDVHRRGRAHPGSSDDDEWEDELPSDVDDDSSLDGGLAFGDYGGKRVSSRQSLESINSQSSAGGLGAWGWRWGGKDKKRRSRNSTSPRPSYAPSIPDSYTAPAVGTSGYAADASRPYPSGQAVYLDDTGRRLPSMTSNSSPGVPTQPLQFVDPQPISDTGVPGSQRNSMPGAFGPDSPPIYRPGPAPLQQPQPTTPIKPAFTQNEDANWSRSSSRTSSNFAQDAALIGAGALGAAGIIAATSSNNSSGKKSRDSFGSNVRFGLTEDQQRKEDRERRREEKQADEDRRKADRTRALKEEAERATRESESRKSEAEAREARQEAIRRTREDENRRAAEAKLAAARREAEEQAQIERERQAEYQRMMREREDAYRREQFRLAEEARLQEERREADERERFIRQQQEGAERRAKERKEEERKSGSKSAGRKRGQSVSEQSEKKQSSSTPWGPIAGVAAAATVGAVIAGRDSRDRKESRDDSRRQDQGYQAKEVTPHTSNSNEPVLDDDIFDPDFFKRKQHTPAERARHEDLARKAADKVISADKVVSDREQAYEDHSTYAEFFSPKDVLSEPAEGKTKVLGPNADNDIQVYHARDAYMQSQLDRSRHGATYGSSKYAPFGVPKLALISPTPPISEASPVRSKTSANSSPSSPLARGAHAGNEAETSPDVETDSDGKSERLNRSISWGEDKTHIYDVQTPESYNEKERDSYVTSPDMRAASKDSPGKGEKKKKFNGVVVEEVGSTGKPKTTTYNEDELAKHYRESARRDFGNGIGAAAGLYRQPFVDSVSDFSNFQLPSPGTEGAPPVRGFVEGETDEATPAQEKTPHIPGGFDDDVYDASAGAPRSDEVAGETAWEPPLSKKEKKKREKEAAKEQQREPFVEEPVAAWEPPLSKKDQKKREKVNKEVDPEPVVEESAAWEPPLSKKEQKKREKAAKRSSTIDSEPSTPVAAEPEVVIDRDAITESPTAMQPAEEPAWEPPLSKKEQKKRDKEAKKQGFADIVSSIDSLPRESRETSEPVEDRTREASPSTADEPSLTKKEQRKQEKQAKKSGFGGFADVADTILATGGIAAAAAALDNSTEDDGFSSTGKKKGKKGKKAKLGEPLDRDIRDAEPESPANESSSMPGGWDESPAPKEEKPDDATAFDPFQYQIHDDDTTAPPTAPEPPTAQEADPWAEFSEPKKNKKKSKRNSSAFNVPEVSSPLRTEVAWDDYVTGEQPPSDTRDVGEESSYTNGHGKDKDSETSRSERTPGEAISTTSDRRGSDYFGDSRQEVSGSSRRTSPDDSRSVASAPTPSRRDENRRGSDYFDEPSYAYETQSVAASEPADVYGSSKKSKRRSRHEDELDPRRSLRDDDDDTRSVTSSRSKREKEESPSVKKDKKSGILGSLFGRKSEREPSSTRSNKDEDEDARRRRKKKHRESEIGGDEDDDTRSVKSSRHRSRSEYGDDDDTRSMKSESRHRSHRSRSEYGDDDDTRSMKSESRHRSHRSETGTEDSRERRRRSTHDGDDRDNSESGKRHHSRRKSGETSRSASRHESRSDSGHRHHRKTNDEDQSFLGMRVEDLPPLPVDVPATSNSVDVDKSVQGVGTPVQTELDAGTVKNDDEHERPREQMLSPETPFPSVEGSSSRPGSSHRAASSTAVPLRFSGFGRAPLTPPVGHVKERSLSFSSPVAPSPVSTPGSPASARKSRQDRPRSTEIKPLYLVERNRKTPEVEDALPSLPSSGPSSRASSVHLSDAYESAVEELEDSPAGKQKLQLDIDGAEKWREEHGDVLGSKETTPKASEAQQPPFFPSTTERHIKQEPQFYTWEDFAREEREHEVDETLPPLPRSRSMSPPKAAEQHVSSDGVKVAAAAAVLGTAAIYAAGELRGKSPERVEPIAERALKSTAQAATPSEPEIVSEPALENDAPAPLVRKSSMKKKGKKTKKSLQWQDEEEAGPAVEAPVLHNTSSPASDATAQQREPQAVFASAAAHTTPVLSYHVEAQTQPEPVNHLLQDDKTQEQASASTATRDLDGNDSSSSLPASTDQPEQDIDRPSTSYKIPTAKAEPAPLVIEERVAAIGTDDAPSETAEIKTAPQLTHKQSKKSKQKQQSVSLFEDEQAPAASSSDDVQVLGQPATGTVAKDDQPSDPAVSEVPESAAQPESRSVEVPTPSVSFSTSDFSNIAQGPAVGWHDSQAEAFHSAMSDQSGNSQTDLEASRDLLVDQAIPLAAEATNAHEAENDAFATVSSKKKGKKGKKQIMDSWSEPEPEPEPKAETTTEATEASGQLIEEPTAAVDKWAPASSSKKSKKGKKKNKSSSAWDEPEAVDEPNPQQAESAQTADAQEPTREIVIEPTTLVEEAEPSSSSKKSKKDKKKSKSFSAWDEPDAVEDSSPLPEQPEPAEAANIREPALEIVDEQPAVVEEPFPISSSKKSKKDKKKNKNVSAWDEPVPEDSTSTTEQGDPVETTNAEEFTREIIEEPIPAADDFVSPSSKKFKKDKKKQKAFAWDEPNDPEEPLPEQAEPEETTDVTPEAVEEPTPVTEEPLPSSSSEKSKKDKKKQKSTAWDEPEVPEEPVQVVEQADPLEPAGEVGEEPTPVAEEPLPSSSSKNKSKKDKKKSFSAWDEPETEDQSGLLSEAPVAVEATESQEPSHEAPREEPSAFEEPTFASSSKKKSKKDKKKSFSAWDEPEPETLMEQAPSPEQAGEEVAPKENVEPIAQATESSPNDNEPETVPDTIVSSAKPTVTDDFSPAVSKKGKKGKKNRQSLTWSEPAPEPAPEPAMPEEDDDAAFVDAEEQHAISSSRPVPEDDQTISKGELLGAVAAAAAGTAMAGLMHEEKAAPEDDFAPVSSKKSKKNKKQKRGLDWSEEPEVEAAKAEEPQDEFVDAEESPAVNEALPVEEQSLKATNAEDLPSAPAPVSAPEFDVPPSTQNDEEFPAANEPAPTFSRKQSKKDKKKNRQSQAWEPESEQASSAVVNEASTEQPVTEIESSEPAQENFVSEELASGEPVPTLSRKQSKKDKKKNRQSTAWDAEPEVETKEEPELSKSKDVEAVVDDGKPFVELPSDVARVPDEVPLPLETSKELTDDAALDQVAGIPTSASEEQQRSSVETESNAADTQPFPSLGDADQSGQEPPSRSIDPFEDEDQQDTHDISTNAEVPEVDDFFGPADPSMQEPSRMTEDLDAFNEPDSLAMEKEKRRAAREAAESARIAESLKERPKDENYANMLTARKPVAKKGGKKGRKSISSATPVYQASPVEDESLGDGQTVAEALLNAEDVAKAEEVLPSAVEEGSVDAVMPIDEPKDEDLWASSSSKKKGKKGKKDRKSISEPANPIVEDSVPAIDDPVPVAEESSVAEQPVTPDVNATAPEEFVDATASPADALQDEEDWTSSSKKKGKKGKKDRKSLSFDTPSTVVEDQSVPQEEPAANSQDLESSARPIEEASRNNEPILNDEPSATPAAEPDEFEWAPTSKKAKKSKKNQSFSDAAPVLEDAAANDEPTIPTETSPGAKEPSTSVEEPSAPVAGAQDDFAWTSGSKKKGKKSKRNQSLSEEAPSQGEPVTSAEPEIAHSEDASREAEIDQPISTSIDDSTAPEAEPQDGFAWSSGSKKKGKKSKRNQSIAEVEPAAPVPAVEESTASNSAEPPFEAGNEDKDATAEPTEIVEERAAIEAQNAPIEETEEFSWSSSLKKKNKKGKKDRSSTSEVLPMEVNESAGEPVAPPEKTSEVPADLDPPQNTINEDSIVEEADSAWAMPSSKKKGKQGKKSLSGTITPAAGETQADVMAMPEEGTSRAVDDEPQVSHEDSAAPAEAQTEEADMWELPSSSGKKKKGKKGKKSGSSTPAIETADTSWSESPVTRDMQDDSLQASQDVLAETVGDSWDSPDASAADDKTAEPEAEVPTENVPGPLTEELEQEEVLVEPSFAVDDTNTDLDAQDKQLATDTIGQEPIKDAAAEDSAWPTDPAPEDDSAWFAPTTSKKKGKKGKKAKEEASSQAVPEIEAEPTPHDVAEQEQPVEFDQQPATISEPQELTQTDDTDIWSLPVKDKKGKKGKNSKQAVVDDGEPVVEPVDLDDQEAMREPDVRSSEMPAFELPAVDSQEVPEPGADDVWAPPAKGKKAKKGKKSKQSWDFEETPQEAPQPESAVIDNEPAETRDAKPMQDLPASDIPPTEPQEAADDDTWAPPAKGKKAKKGKKSKQSWDVEEPAPETTLPESNAVEAALLENANSEPNTTNDVFQDAQAESEQQEPDTLEPTDPILSTNNADTPLADDKPEVQPREQAPQEDNLHNDSATSVEAGIPEVENRDTEEPTPASEALETEQSAETDSFILKPSKKDKKKAKKNRASASDPWAGTETAESAATASEPIEEDHKLSLGVAAVAGAAALAAGAIAAETTKTEPEPEEEWGGYETKKSKKDKKKGKKSGGLEPEVVPDVAEPLPESTREAPEPATEAIDAGEATEPAVDDEWGSFSIKKSKKDKKKAKQSGTSTPIVKEEELVEPVEERHTVVTDSLDEPDKPEPEPEVAAASAEPAEEEWGSFSTKKSKKDKKKSRQSGSSTPAIASGDQPVEVNQPEAFVVEDAPAEVAETTPVTETAPVTQEPAEDEWASSFSTKKSKKDKKKARQTEFYAPANSREEEPVEANEPEAAATADNFGETARPDAEMESAPAGTEPAEPAEAEWGSFSTKKSKKDKKKSRQTEFYTPPVAAEEEAVEAQEPDPTSVADNIAEATELEPKANSAPAEDEWGSFSTKKSKKDKKKGKKSGSSTPAFAGEETLETAERDPEAVPVADEPPVEEKSSVQQDAIPVLQAEEPEVEDWTNFSTAKKSKKDKKKAKKSGLSTPALEDEPSTTPREVSEDSAVAEPAPEVALSADNPSIDKTLDELPASSNQDMPPQSNDNQSPGQDIDFAATLAAGLANTGFNPDMVVNDPVFHRRASPTGSSPEPVTEEDFGTTVSKRKKGKKGKSREISLEDAPTASEAIGKVPVNVSADDFNDTISQSLQGTGFDPALLEKALASQSGGEGKDNVNDDEPEFSFATSKKKKGKKGKQNSVGVADDVAVETDPIEAPDQRTEKLTQPQEATPTAAAQDNDTREMGDPSAHSAMAGDGEMDVDEMDKAYKAYKKNKRKQRKLKASIGGSSDNPESSAVDTGMSAAVSDNEARSRGGMFDDGARAGEKTGLEGFIHTSEISQSLPVAVGKNLPHPEEASSSSVSNMAAAGVAGLAAGSLASSGQHKHLDKSSQAHRAAEPDWSFNSLQESDRGVPDAPQGDNKEYQPIRDSGYEEAARSAQNSTRSSREVPPAIVRTSSSHESLRNRRSLEPLRISTGSTPEEEWGASMTPEKRTSDNDQKRSAKSNDKSLHGHSRTPSAVTADTPLLPTTSAGSSSQFQAYDPATPSQRSGSEGYFKMRGDDGDRSSKGGSQDNSRPPFSPTSAGGPLSPRTPLRSIAEENHTSKRSKADSDVGGPDQNKLTKRSETPKDIQAIRSRQRTLSPEIRLPGSMPMGGSSRATSNPLSTDDIIKRLSWPAVDEENDTVNIERSMARKAIMPGDMRSPSVVSNRSATPGTYNQLRSFSRNSNASNHSHSSTPSLRRINLSGDLRAASRRGETGSSVSGSAPTHIPFEAPPTPPLNDDDLTPGSASRAGNMSDVFQGYGDAAESHVSPTRPPSVRKRQSMHINELESRLDSLVAENRALQEARQSQDSSRYVVNDTNLLETLQQRELDLQAKDVEINQIKAMLQPLQEEIARLAEMNNGLTEANRNLVDDTNGRYATLQAEHKQAHEQWQSTTRNLEAMQQEHGRITSGMKDILEAEIANALSDKNAEILRLREQLDIATEQIRALQVQIQSSSSSDFLVQRDEDYFDGSCQKLCQHVQQWVLRFSKLSDNRVCRLSTELNDDKLEARLDNAVLDGSDVDKLLTDRIKRRDIFMSVVMTMVWEYIFTRYLFGMDREQRQKLKALEKLLSDVGPPRAVAHWRATTLTLLSKRPNFANQCAMDTEAVAIEIFGILCSLLPPPSNSEAQLLASLQRVIRIAVDLSIEMRCQRAEYIMLPPLQPEYDTNGDLVRKVHFNASLMNERSGFFSSNEELAAEHAVVKIVLFPLVVKKGDEIGEGEEEIVVCPAQVLVRNDAGKGKKVVRVMSGAMEIDDPIRSRSRLSQQPSMMGSEGGAF